MESLAESRIDVTIFEQSSYLCPLTLQPISEPVVSPSGTIYERQAIMEHVRLAESGGSVLCPVTLENLKEQDLKPLDINELQNSMLSASMMGDLQSMKQALKMSME